MGDPDAERLACDISPFRGLSAVYVRFLSTSSHEAYLHARPVARRSIRVM